MTLLVLGAPIVLGLAWTLLPAFGYFPAIGGTGLTLEPWRVLFASPGFNRALLLTLTTGIGTAVLALLAATSFCAMTAHHPSVLRLRSALPPLLASPPSAMALGFAFVIMPSGWLVRLVSPWATGLDRPPIGLVTVQDPLGLSLIGGLLLKEVPYLVLVIFAASGQVPVERTLAAARALGQRPATAWLKAVFPQVYPQIRLPVFAVLAFSLSVVDVALILAPGNPPPLAVLATRWFSNYDLSLYYPAAAAASLQLVLVIFGVIAWLAMERTATVLGHRWIERGGRSRIAQGFTVIAGSTTIALGALGIVALGSMALWSVAGAWRFPDALPETWQLSMWRTQANPIGGAAEATAVIGLASVAVAAVLTLACLENEQRHGIRPGLTALWLLYLPLLVPQIAFLFGVQVALIRLGLDGTLFAVAWAHLVFVLPYVFLTLADPFRTLDPRYAVSAAALGAGKWRVFFAVKLPLLTRPFLVACAVGFAVSVGQYLPTLFAGAGRIATLTTEAVTLSSGGDRRILGIYAVLQTALPLLGYGLALWLPRLLFRRFRGLA
ncbi:ABC transporter permease [Microvirga aerilata]|uniref:ABC transporter permease n=1 Tax=Microvirga aerilata TaxID=670292 RepID=UPI001FE5C36F|nr:ABC transporter permease subunit [Microvirga aerilata]